MGGHAQPTQAQAAEFSEVLFPGPCACNRQNQSNQQMKTKPNERREVLETSSSSALARTAQSSSPGRHIIDSFSHANRVHIGSPHSGRTNFRTMIAQQTRRRRLPRFRHSSLPSSQAVRVLPLQLQPPPRSHRTRPRSEPIIT